MIFSKIWWYFTAKFWMFWLPFMVYQAVFAKKIDAFFKLMSINLMIFSKFWYKINCSTLITHNSFLTLSFRQQYFLNELEIKMASWKVESCLDGSVIWSWWFFRFKPNWNENLMFLPQKKLTFTNAYISVFSHEFLTDVLKWICGYQMIRSLESNLCLRRLNFSQSLSYKVFLNACSPLGGS